VTTPTEQTPKDRLAELIRELAVVHGRVTLSSGREADYYVDMRRLTLHHEAAPLIGHLMLDLLEESGMGVGEIDAVGGPTMGADPVVCAIQHAAASRGLDLDAFLVRKEAKGHGMKRQVEGPEITGRRVVVVEDTTTTGGSPMLAVEAARAVGAEVVGVATILDRETEATEVFRRADLPYVSLLSSSDLGLARQ
jgi:orotate phosphoribosyltransferase